MLHSRFSRLAVAAVAVSASVGAAIGFTGPASAVLQIKCTGLTNTGGLAGTITLTGCTPAATGGSSMPIAASSFATGGTINWVNGKSTTITLSAVAHETDTTETGKCPAGTTEYEATGKVTADNTGFAPVNGKASGEACVNTVGAGSVANEPGSKFKLK